jgi:NTP pyrophosphatase (non-canonical NTP hydrolase)
MGVERIPEFKGYIVFGCGKHPRNAQGANGYDIDCLDCQRQPAAAWFDGMDVERYFKNGRLVHAASVQMIVADWCVRCFGTEHAFDTHVRALRLAEEAIEFAQSVLVDTEKLHSLIDYVYSKPAGQPSQELGGVSITLLAACSSAGVEISEVLEAELKRILAKSPEHFANRNQVKVDAGFR